ncbi:hypothetical protein Btru_037456 [Bulinus truncatus]|nr:hypothetical protein Btru_037456 [Bulinus truncatus]
MMLSSSLLKALRPASNVNFLRMTGVSNRMDNSTKRYKTNTSGPPPKTGIMMMNLGDQKIKEKCMIFCFVSSQTKILSLCRLRVN